MQTFNPKVIAFAAVFKIDFPAPVWQVRPDEQNLWLAVETRNADALQNNFYVLDSRNGKFILEDFKTQSSWWSGLADLYDGKLYLHNEANQKFGRHLGITTIEPLTGKFIWEQPTYSFYGLTAEYLLAWELVEEAANYIPLAYVNGERLPFEVSAHEAKSMVADFNAQRQQKSLSPGHYPESSKYFKDLQLFLKEKTKHQPQLAIDYLETGRFFVAGYYVGQPNNKLNYFVAAFALTGELLFHEQMTTNGEGIGADNFFILQDTLILLKNRNTLLGYKL